MSVMLIYVVCVALSETLAVEIGLYLDNLAPTYSLPLALTLFFAALFFSWPVAVKITERWLLGRSATRA